MLVSLFWRLHVAGLSGIPHVATAECFQETTAGHSKALDRASTPQAAHVVTRQLLWRIIFSEECIVKIAVLLT